jgi:hypothetical protein
MGRGDGVSPFVDVAVFTGMGAARNALNVLSSDVDYVTLGDVRTATTAAEAVEIVARLLGGPSGRE